MAPLPALTETTDDQSTICESPLPSESPRSDSGSHATTLTSPTSRSSSSRDFAFGSLATLEASIESNPQRGWPILAQRMAQEPDLEAFRRFRELNVKTLLYYQVEIAALEDKLRCAEQADACKPDHGRGPKEGRYVRLADKMIETQDNLNPNDRKQCDLVFKIRDRLRDYSKKTPPTHGRVTADKYWPDTALLQHAQISALPQADYRNVESLRVWMIRENLAVMGKGSDTWGNTDEPEKLRPPLEKQIWPLVRSLFWPRKSPSSNPDLVATASRQNLDGLTRWIAQEWVPFWHQLRNKPVTEADDPHYVRLKRYSESTMLKFTSFVATVVACLLPTVTIGILTTAETRMQKLGYIAGFTALFSIGLMWLTEPTTSRTQIFGATAAFSAVLVVFVST